MCNICTTLCLKPSSCSWEAATVCPHPDLQVLKDKFGITPRELGLSKSIECDIFPFSTLTLLVGRQEGHPAECWFVGSDDLTGALHDLQLQ